MPRGGDWPTAAPTDGQVRGMGASYARMVAFFQSLFSGYLKGFLDAVVLPMVFSLLGLLGLPR